MKSDGRTALLGSWEPSAPHLPDQSEVWQILTRATAAAAVALVAMRVALPQGLTVGILVAAVLIPVWYPTTRHFSGVRKLLFVGVLALLSGIVLNQLSRVDHDTNFSGILSYSLLLVDFLVGIGIVVWARTLMTDAAVGMWFGVGLLLGVSSGTASFAANPWRFGFSVAVTVLVLALAQMSGNRILELLALFALTAASALTDARSSFAILLLTAVLVAWQMRPNGASRKGSAARALLAIAAIAVVVYNLGQALILDGYLGESTQQRSLAQVDASGSLILGGRPELAATAALMQHSPSGFGPGVHASLQDILVAKSGMIAINYQPNNGYVERYMFGSGFELHSVIGDLWANFGILGLVLAAAILVVALRGLGTAIANNAASALFIYLGAKTLWNLLFSPFYSSVPLMVLLIGLAFLRRSSRTSEPGSESRVDAPADPLASAGKRRPTNALRSST